MIRYILLIFLFFSNNALGWKQVDCSKIRASLKNFNYETFNCEKKVQGGVHSEWLIADNYQGSPRETLYIQHDYFLDSNSRWSNNWAIQALKRDRMENEIRYWNIGTIKHIDNQPIKLEGFNGVYYKKFETSMGKGFLVTSQIHNHIFALGYLLESTTKSFDEQLVRELYSSINVPGAKTAKVVEKKYSNNKSSSDSTQENFIEFCKNSNLGDLSEDVAQLCIDKLN